MSFGLLTEFSTVHRWTDLLVSSSCVYTATSATDTLTPTISAADTLTPTTRLSAGGAIYTFVHILEVTKTNQRTNKDFLVSPPQYPHTCNTGRAGPSSEPG